MKQFEYGVMYAAGLLAAIHDQTSMAADIIVEAGLAGVNCSKLDDTDKANLRLINDQRLHLSGLDPVVEQQPYTAWNTRNKRMAIAILSGDSAFNISGREGISSPRASQIAKNAIRDAAHIYKERTGNDIDVYGLYWARKHKDVLIPILSEGEDFGQ